MSSGEESEPSSNSMASSSTSESKLPLNSGTLFESRPSELLEDREMMGVVVFASDVGSQQKVSRFHNLQLKFSNLWPSSKDPAHLEKTVHML
jgi:hypothetical protein